MYSSKIIKDSVFISAFTKAEISNYSEQERNEYQQSLKVYRDLKGVIDTAFDEGKIEGKMEGKIEGKIERDIEFVLNANEMGLSISDIAKLTQLTEAEVIEIINKYKS
jgi:predicted transposase/invertase (TIGR01784 family)